MKFQLALIILIVQIDTLRATKFVLKPYVQIFSNNKTVNLLWKSYPFEAEWYQVNWINKESFINIKNVTGNNITLFDLPGTVNTIIITPFYRNGKKYKSHFVDIDTTPFHTLKPLKLSCLNPIYSAINVNINVKLEENTCTDVKKMYADKNLQFKILNNERKIVNLKILSYKKIHLNNVEIFSNIPFGQYYMNMTILDLLKSENNQKFRTINIQRITLKSENYKSKIYALEPPRGVKGLVLSATSVLVKWNLIVDINLDLDHLYDQYYLYEINFKDVDSDYHLKRSVNVTRTDDIISDLKPFTKYEIFMRTLVNYPKYETIENVKTVIRKEQYSSPSLSIFVMTFELKPSSPPHNISIHTFDNDSILKKNIEMYNVEVKWELPTNFNGNFDGYNVNFGKVYKLSNFSKSIKWADQLNLLKSYIVIRHLSPNLVYILRIAAINSKGSSPPIFYMFNRNFNFQMNLIMLNNILNDKFDNFNKTEINFFNNVDNNTGLIQIIKSNIFENEFVVIEKQEIIIKNNISKNTSVMPTIYAVLSVVTFGGFICLILFCKKRCYTIQKKQTFKNSFYTPIGLTKQNSTLPTVPENEHSNSKDSKASSFLNQSKNYSIKEESLLSTLSNNHKSSLNSQYNSFNLMNYDENVTPDVHRLLEKWSLIDIQRNEFDKDIQNLIKRNSFDKNFNINKIYTNNPRRQDNHSVSSTPIRHGGLIKSKKEKNLIKSHTSSTNPANIELFENDQSGNMNANNFSREIDDIMKYL
ncbi:hypothetical protein A3Q56_05164 [Intoshia linei]|uniref:Fibronectin type-III domain-containing protein n=1 Tax=Intoshia linei TaxID=1819745 RepID=A0A177AYQ4_9BILA|nr:hypothetical protein A3Q56_05164 [Intoshia linei]